MTESASYTDTIAFDGQSTHPIGEIALTHLDDQEVVLPKFRGKPIDEYPTGEVALDWVDTSQGFRCIARYRKNEEERICARSGQPIEPNSAVIELTIIDPKKPLVERQPVYFAVTEFDIKELAGNDVDKVQGRLALHTKDGHIKGIRRRYSRELAGKVLRPNTRLGTKSKQ